MANEAATKKTRKPVSPRKKTRAVSSGKGKKRDVKRNIPTELIPIEEETWLLQPIAVTMMRHDYSLIQIRILVSIVEFMQNKLYDILNRKKTQPEIFPDAELGDDGRLEVKTYFKNFKGKYPENFMIGNI